jgi:hypothetical protein
MGSWLGRGSSIVNEGFVLFVDYFLHRLVEQIKPRLAIVIGQCWCSSKSLIASFLHCYYERPKWCYFLLNAAYDKLILTMTYSMHVDGLRIKNKYHQKEGDRNRPIAVFCGTDSIMWNILPFILNVRNIVWDWQYSTKYYWHSGWMIEYSSEHCQSHITLPWAK